MSQSTRVSPPNSIVFISDPNGGAAPYPVRGPLILSSPSCISVGCKMEQDGPTEFVLGRAHEVDPGSRPAFDGPLETPNYAVVVSTVDRELLLSDNVPTTRTRVRIWVNHPTEPDRVIVGLE